MVRLAANLTWLFSEHPFYERFARAADAGFRGVEFFFPFGHDAERIRHEVDRHDLTLVLHNLPVGDFEAGERGFVAHADRSAEFLAGVDEAIRYDRVLRPERVNTPSGPAPETSASLDTLVDHLRTAADRLAQIDVGLVLEPINRGDVPGALIDSTAKGVDVVRRTGSDNLGIQYDLYHSLQAGEDPAQVLEQHLAFIHHIQIADVPGRHELGTGDVDFEDLFARLDGGGYAGWVALEYHPQGETVASLDVPRALGLLDGRVPADA